MTRAIKFTKGHETGNDFVLVSDPDNELGLTQQDYAFLADRHVGVGGSGVIRAVRAAHVPDWVHLIDEEPDLEWFIDARSPDGSETGDGADGIRVFVAFLVAEGLVDLKHGDRIVIGTRGGIKDVQVGANGIFRVDLGRWAIGNDTNAPADAVISAPGLDVPRPALGISVGNPHAVVALADAAQLRGLNLVEPPAVRPQFARDVTVAFVVPADPLIDDGIGRISVRAYVAGVGETLSCGSAAAATALATRHWAGQGAPHHWKAEFTAGSLGVQMFPTEEGEHVSLSGPAELVYSGIIAV